MTSRAVTGLLAALLALRASAPAHAQMQGVVHVAREGETVASIAQQYYGDPRREVALVAENGLGLPEGAAVPVGLRLTIPSVGYHRARDGETWGTLGRRYYGAEERGLAIAEANHADPARPPAGGVELLVPYPLRYVAEASDTLRHLAEVFYGTAERYTSLRNFNRARSNRLERGDVVLVPLDDLELSADGRRAIAAQTGEAPAAGETRDIQRRIDRELPRLQERIQRGQFVETVAEASRLLGSGVPTDTQVVSIHRALAIAYVALDREDLAVEAFGHALEQQPDLELDRARTSPKVLRVLELAKRQRQQQRLRATGARAPGRATPVPPPSRD